MQLNELKIRIKTELPDEELQILLDDAQDFVFGYLNNYSTNDSEPNRVKKLIANYVYSSIVMSGSAHVKSESLDSMSQTFESKNERDIAFRKELASLGLRKLRW